MFTREERLEAANRERRRLRNQRRGFIAHIEAKGITPTRPQYMYRVEPEVIWIPDWAQDKRVADLGISSDYVWLKDHTLARMVARMDRNEGGQPKLDRFEAVRCRRCGMLRLGTLARSRRALNESARDGRDKPCGPECMVRYHQRRGHEIR